VPEAEMVAALVDEAERIMSEGVEARVTAAKDGAAAIAAEVRAEMLAAQGLDPNSSEETVARIREISG